jgi:hypothetical protein
LKVLLTLGAVAKGLPHAGRIGLEEQFSRLRRDNLRCSRDASAGAGNEVKLNGDR